VLLEEQLVCLNDMVLLLLLLFGACLFLCVFTFEKKLMGEL
jgi:hypothetical protein